VSSVASSNLTLVARAKLTWNLEIIRRRDDGYHELRSEMTTIAFSDVLNLDEGGDYLQVLSPTQRRVPADNTNLVARALRLVNRRAGVIIEKIIPVGGGLGGGSADAAAILRWAGGVSAVEALTLGGDVPFCQVGGRALVEGVGEEITTLPFEARDVTLMIPSFSVSTADVYSAYDELVAGRWRPTGANHLEVPAGVVSPQLHTTLQWLRATYGSRVRLAGSGSTMFVEGHLQGALSQWAVPGPEGLIQLYQTTTTPN
jgi:4-diphosphocytidyl-2-C-methyl-D-erythritol kinase